jgi:carbon starvation protein
MNLLWLALPVTFAFLIAYFIYGRFLSKSFELNNQNPTPAHQMQDGIDFVPAKKFFLLGQHFSAITAAGPIVGPIIAGLYFGWLPALLWIVLGAIFIGAMHDFSSLVGSIRHKARSIAEIVREHMSKRAYLLFLTYIWLALIYVIIAFTDITARTFVNNIVTPSGDTILGSGIAMTSLLYLLLGILMGILLHKFKMTLWKATCIFIPLVCLVVWIGQMIPLNIPPFFANDPVKTWNLILLIYCGIASILPVWLLLQPRGYLGGFFLYTVLAAGCLGILLGGFKVNYPAFLGFSHQELGPLFPMLFITIACGACSGFHGIVCSGTTSKQLQHETDARMVGYGGMLLEGIIAFLSLGTVIILAQEAPQIRQDPNMIYAQGIGNFLGIFGIPIYFAISFGLLAFATFVYDTLDVATRLSRYILQELFGLKGKIGAWIATLITLALPFIFVNLSVTDPEGKPIPGWKIFWTIFGSSNQLLAALTLLGITVWLKKKGKHWWITAIPMTFMLVMTLWSLVLMSLHPTGFKSGIIRAIALVLLALACLLVFEAIKSLRKKHLSPI